MFPQAIEGATHVMTAPKDLDQSKDDTRVLGLPVKVVENEMGQFFVSAWEPTPEEVKILNSGGKVYLWVRGPGHPVVMMEAKS